MKTIYIVCLLLMPLFVPSGYKVGEKVEGFSLQNAVDNNTVTLSNYINTKAVVLIFTCNECPFSRLYEDRIKALSKAYQQNNIKFLLINVNSGQSGEESATASAQRAKEQGFTFPYLLDPDQKIAKMYGVSKVPEAYVLESKNGSFVLRYRGAIDDNPQMAEGTKNNYLKDAIAAILSNSTIKVTEKKPTGCVIKKNQ